MLYRAHAHHSALGSAFRVLALATSVQMPSLTVITPTIHFFPEPKHTSAHPVAFAAVTLCPWWPLFGPGWHALSWFTNHSSNEAQLQLLGLASRGWTYHPVPDSHCGCCCPSLLVHSLYVRTCTLYVTLLCPAYFHLYSATTLSTFTSFQSSWESVGRGSSHARGLLRRCGAACRIYMFIIE